MTKYVGAARGISLAAVALVVSACSEPLMRSGDTYDTIQGSFGLAAKAKAPAESFNESLLPPVQLDFPKSAQAVEPRFDLSVNSAPAGQVFLALVSGTRYSMVLPPDLSGTLTLNLKNVTVREALESVREIYGYEFSVQGTRITVQPNSLQTKLFQVSYLATKRGGGSATRVMTGNVVSSSSGAAAGAAGAAGGGGGASVGAGEATTVFTGQASDFWFDLTQAIAITLNCEFDVQRATGQVSGASPASAMMAQAIIQRMDKVHCPDARNFVINQQSGVVMVRAMPSELRDIGRLLKAMQASVERQVMLEAKIVEVALGDDFQSGINWQMLDNTNKPRWSMNADTDNIRAFPPAVGSGSPLTGTFGVLKKFNVGGALGLAFQTDNFAALLQFMQTQGTVNVMSSPRIATLNNQKAVLKVGTDDYYVTAVTPPSYSSSGTGTTSSNSINPPTITTQPFFSGIALDVTPQIDESGQITLHIRPSITEVTEREKIINFGSLGIYSLPYASTKVKETDSIVRVRDGMIVAIGGLMTRSQTEQDIKVPGAGDLPLVGHLFKQAVASKGKRELVVLIKPTVINEDADWQQDLTETEGRLREMDPRNWKRMPDPLIPR